MEYTVLLIEDDALYSQLLGAMIGEWGYTVHVARSGEEGLEQLAARVFDAVVTDIRLPGITGEEVLRRARTDTPDLPVILITGHGSVKAAVEAMQQGAFHYLLKPADPNELRVVLARAIEDAALRRENRFLRSAIPVEGAPGRRLLGQGPAMQAVFDLMARVARTDSTVLITGETGAGKELVARTLHCMSRRSDRLFVACNCAALHANLLESELFGHERGAFTGAVAQRRGRFEEADGGTLFLDEIAETSREFQAKLLRVLQEGEFERVGGNQTLRSDARIMASTNRDLAAAVRAGSFREDLYYRLRVVPLHVPPLRERPEDILPLARHFLRHYAAEYASAARELAPAAEAYLLAQPWQGNVRELQHTLERAVVLARGPVLEAADLAVPPAAGAPAATADDTLQHRLDDATREHVLRVLDQAGWRKQLAADRLGIDRVTLYRLLKKYSLEKQPGDGR